MTTKVQRDPGNIIYPCPVALITTIDNGSPNVATMCKVLNLSVADPVLVGVCIRSSTHTHKLIGQQKEFVINFPSADLIDKVVDAGGSSGRDVKDKVSHLGLTALPAEKVSPPLIAECPVNIECRLHEIHPVGDHNLVIGEVLVEHIDEDRLSADDEPDTHLLDPLIMLHGGFWHVGDSVQSYKGY